MRLGDTAYRGKSLLPKMLMRSQTEVWEGKAFSYRNSMGRGIEVRQCGALRLFMELLSAIEV